MGTCCVKGKKKQTNGRGFAGGPVYLDNDNRKPQNKHVYKEDSKTKPDNLQTISVKKDKNLTEDEREQRRLQALAAAEKRQMEIDMKGMTKEAYEEFKHKQKAAMETEKYKTSNDKGLQWRVG